MLSLRRLFQGLGSCYAGTLVDAKPILKVAFCKGLADKLQYFIEIKMRQVSLREFRTRGAKALEFIGGKFQKN